jgi:carbamate kinase
VVACDGGGSIPAAEEHGALNGMDAVIKKGACIEENTVRER